MVKAEVEKTSDLEYAITALKEGTLSFLDFTDEFVDFVDTGGALIAKPQLDGIPFGIVGVTFREGFSRVIKGQKYKGDYASLKVMIADERTLDACGADWRNRGLKPLDIRILNDGGTGIRRQICRYLHTRSYAVITTASDDDVSEGGGLGQSDFDTPVGLWADVLKGDKYLHDDGSKDGVLTYEVEFDRMVIANRGLRVSKYSNDEGESETWYLA